MLYSANLTTQEVIIESSSVLINRKSKNKSLFKNIDLFIFFLLIFLVLLFQLQLILPWLSTLRMREILYLYLFTRVLFFYKKEFNYNLIYIYLFIVYCIFIALHTYILHGSDMMITGFIRFISVALLAPLANALITDLKLIKLIIYIWITIILLGFFTAIYQNFIGNIEWISGDYLSTRNGLIRYKTILGEPNIGGMGSSFLFAYGVLITKGLIKKTIIINSSILFMIFSVSKAAVVGFILVLLLLRANKIKLFFSNMYNGIIYKKTIINLIITIILVLSSIVAFQFLSQKIRSELIEYYEITSIVVFEDSNLEGSGVTQDLMYRVLEKTILSIGIASEQSDFYLLNILIGSSFGIAGSSAREIRGISNTILPHNSYLEIYLIGGLILLYLFIMLIIKTRYSLSTLVRKDDYFYFLFIVFLISIIYMITYPIIYQPILGSIFWIIVGISSNSEVIIKNFQTKADSISLA